MKKTSRICMVLLIGTRLGCSWMQPSEVLIGQDLPLEGGRIGDGYWANAEDRKHYKPLVVALVYQDTLLQRPGVVGVRAGYGELHVYTTIQTGLPPDLWGVPVRTLPPTRCPACIGGETAPDPIPPEIPSIYRRYF